MPTQDLDDEVSVGASAWADVCGQFKSEFERHFKDIGIDIVSHGGKRLVEHVTISGLPRLGGSSHASVGNGNVNVSAVIGCELSRTDPADTKVMQLVAGGIEPQTYRCCQIIEQILSACQADWADLVRLTAHIPDLTDAKAEALDCALSYFCQERGCPAAARTVIGCSRLRLSAAVQIEASAVTNFRETAGAVDTCPLLSSPISTASLPAPSPPALSTYPSPPPASSPPPPGLFFSTSPLVGESVMPSGQSTPATSSQACHDLHMQSTKHGEPLPNEVDPAAVREPFSSLDIAANIGMQVECSDELEASPQECFEERAASSVDTTSPQRCLPASSGASTTTSPQQQQDSQTSGKEQGAAAVNEDVEWQAAATFPLGAVLGAPPSQQSPPMAKAANERQSRKKARAAKEAAAKEAEVLALAASIAAPPKATPLSATATRFVPTPPQNEKLPLTKPPTAPPAAPPSAALEAAPAQPRPEAETTKSLRPFAGHAQSLRLEDVSDKALCPRAERQEPNTAAWRVQMIGSDSYRTVRLGPSMLRCSKLIESSWAARAKGRWPVTWSYEFDITLTKTAMSFMNIGLVEWTAQAKESADIFLQGSGAESPSLTELMGISLEDEWTTDPSWQQHSENPQQMMLGCRKGSKWYGNNRMEPLFKDDLCEGSTLRFRCDHVFDDTGRAIRMKLWLLPCSVVFKFRGAEVVQLAKPLFEWPDPKFHTDKIDEAKPQMRTMWVPAVTLYSKGDSIVFSWCGRENGDCPAAGIPEVVTENSSGHPWRKS